MENRLKFKNSQQRDFLLQVYKASNLSTNELAKIAGVVPRSFRDWRHEKLSIPLKAALTFKDKFKVLLPESPEILVNRWKKGRSEAGRKGGFALFRKHGSPGTPEGRRKGGSKALKILREKGIIPPAKTYKTPRGFNKYLAEYVGILLGDGGITREQVFITLNSEADKNYAQFVINLITRLFSEKPSTGLRKDSKAINIYLSGINLVQYLIKLGLKVGNKVKQQVAVPNWVLKSNDYKIACLRGLMDTDGGIFIHRYKVNGKEYKYLKLCFTNQSLPLIDFVYKTLKSLSFNPKIVLNVASKKVWLYNMAEVKRYIEVVGTSNSRLQVNIRRVTQTVTRQVC